MAKPIDLTEHERLILVLARRCTCRIAPGCSPRTKFIFCRCNAFDVPELSDAACREFTEG